MGDPPYVYLDLEVCHIPNLVSVDIFFALAYTEEVEIFRSPLVRGLVQCAWWPSRWRANSDCLAAPDSNTDGPTRMDSSDTKTLTVDDAPPSLSRATGDGGFFLLLTVVLGIAMAVMIWIYD